jgi:hypothetical protein
MILHLSRFVLAPLLALSIGGATATASTIYTTGAPNQADGLDISEFVAADNFTLSVGSTITGLTFFASANVDPFTSQFSNTLGYGIFANNNGVPGSLIASGSNSAPVLVDTGNQILGTEEWAISMALPSLSLAPGTYWLGLHENALGTPDDGTTIYWDTASSQTGFAPMSTDDLFGASGWYPGLSENLDLAFQLNGSFDTGASPEPNQFWALLAIGACTLAWSVQRHRRAGRRIP